MLTPCVFVHCYGRGGVLFVSCAAKKFFATVMGAVPVRSSGNSGGVFSFVEK